MGAALWATYALCLPQSAYQRISARATDQMHSREAVTAFLRASHVPDKALRVMATNFNEDEQANAAHTTAAAESKTTSFAGVEVYRYSSSGDRRSWADFD